MDEPRTPPRHDDAALPGEPLDTVVDLLRAEVAQLKRALDGRGPIEQAKGMLMWLHRVSPDDAWERLQRTSQDHNVRVAVLAEFLCAIAADRLDAADPGMRAALDELLHGAVRLPAVEP